MPRKTEVAPAPVEHHHDAVAKPDQKIQVGKKPEEPGGQAGKTQLAKQRHFELNHRRAASDGGQRAVIGVVKSLRWCMAQAGQDIGRHAAPHLFGRRADAWHGFAVAVHSRHVANDTDLRETRHAQIGLHGHAAGAVKQYAAAV